MALYAHLFTVWVGIGHESSSRTSFLAHSNARLFMGTAKTQKLNCMVFIIGLSKSSQEITERPANEDKRRLRKVIPVLSFRGGTPYFLLLSSPFCQVMSVSVDVMSACIKCLWVCRLRASEHTAMIPLLASACIYVLCCTVSPVPCFSAQSTCYSVRAGIPSK